MLEFDDLFSKKDPYGSFAALLVDQPTDDLRATARGLLNLDSTKYEDVFPRLRDSRPGMDIRPLVLFAAKSEGLLINLHEAHEMVAAQIALAAPTMRVDEGFEAWLLEKAAEGLRAVVEEDARHAANQVEIPYPLPDYMACLYEVLEVPIENLRRAAAAVNDLPRMERISFVRIFLQATAPEAVVREFDLPIMEILEHAKAGITVLYSQKIDRIAGDDE